MNTLFGLSVVVSDTCIKETRLPRIEKLPNKRRRRYRLTYEVAQEPVAYKHDDKFIAHPSIIEKLKEVSRAA